MVSYRKFNCNQLQSSFTFFFQNAKKKIRQTPNHDIRAMTMTQLPYIQDITEYCVTSLFSGSPARLSKANNFSKEALQDTAVGNKTVCTDE